MTSGEIYEELETINASAAESKARRILFGLGKLLIVFRRLGHISLYHCGLTIHLYPMTHALFDECKDLTLKCKFDQPSTFQVDGV